MKKLFKEKPFAFSCFFICLIMQFCTWSVTPYPKEAALFFFVCSVGFGLYLLFGTTDKEKNYKRTLAEQSAIYAPRLRPRPQTVEEAAHIAGKYLLNAYREANLRKGILRIYEDEKNGDLYRLEFRKMRHNERMQAPDLRPNVPAAEERKEDLPTQTNSAQTESIQAPEGEQKTESAKSDLQGAPVIVFDEPHDMRN